MRFIEGMAAAVLLATACSAAPIQLSGTGSYGSFTGSIEYLPATSKLVLTLTNTTLAQYGGYITAVALNDPKDKITGGTLSSTDPDFKLIGNPSFNDAVSASPYGKFDFGASLTSDWLGGGSPVKGIKVGDSATFTFTLSGSLAGLTTEDFINEMSEDTSKPAALVVRFRGMWCDLSDKVVATFTVLPPPQGQIPEPSTYALMGLGLAGLAFTRKLKSRA